MEVYFDNSATTRCREEVAELVMQMMIRDYGNPSALHLKGIQAENEVKSASVAIAKTLHGLSKEIVFTSGGTESNNMAILGTAAARNREGKHIITTKIEHPSVRKTMQYLEENGYRITYLDVDTNGHIDLDTFRSALTAETILVSIMMVNNEVGYMLPIKEIGELIRTSGYHPTFHVDAIQAYGKLPIHVKNLGIDLLSVSGHKINGPKGIGFLYIKSGTKIRPVTYGGGQQKGMRSGTLNVPGIAGIGLAAKLAYEEMESRTQQLVSLKSELAKRLKKMGAVINTPIEYSAPQILNISFKGIRSEVLLHALEEKEIYVSSGSACASNHPSDNSTLKNQGISTEITDASVRISLGMYNHKEEVDYMISCLHTVVPILQKFSRR